MKSRAVKRVLRPVRPPSSTPTADSTKAVTVESPKSAPREEKKASTFSVSSSFSESSNILPPTPVKVPTESNTSVTRKAMTTGMTAKEVKALKSSSKAIGAIEAGIEKNESGILLRPVTHAITAPTVMAIINDPCTLFACKYEDKKCYT